MRIRSWKRSTVMAAVIAFAALFALEASAAGQAPDLPGIPAGSETSKEADPGGTGRRAESSESPSSDADASSSEATSESEDARISQVDCPSGQVENPNTGECERDRDCLSDFDTQQEAQEFFESRGGPDDDPHRLDEDPGEDDGVACENLPSRSAPEGGVATGLGGATTDGSASASLLGIGALLCLLGLALGGAALQRRT